MTHDKHEDRSRRTWEGDVTVVEERRKEYVKAGDFVRWISTLYSFRYVALYAAELLGLLPSMRDYAKELVQHWLGFNGTDEELADECDVLSSVLMWATLEKHSGIKECMKEVDQVVDLGLRVADKGLGPHTASLLATTKAFLLVRKGRRAMARERLAFARARVEHIKNKNQQVRVFKRLALGYAQLQHPMLMPLVPWYYVRAVLVWSAPRAVRMKAAMPWR